MRRYDGSRHVLWYCCCWCALAMVTAGCATTRTVTILAKPEDAVIKIDGVNRGMGPVTHEFVYEGPSDTHVVTVNRTGYEEANVQLSRDDKRKIVEVQLEPLSRLVHFTVQPVAGILRINGEAVSSEPVQVHSERLQFTVDAKNNWTSYTVTAERENFQPAQTSVTWTDNTQEYTLRLEPLRKDLRIDSTPPGAQVFVRGESEPLGTTPLVAPDRPFPFDVRANAFVPLHLVLRKPGYDDLPLTIGWDEGRADYAVEFQPKTKDVLVRTDPPGADVVIEGAEPVATRDNATVFRLAFPPVNEQGELRVYEGMARKAPVDESEWEPRRFTIAWDDGTTDYNLALKEIVTRPVPMVSVSLRRAEQGWTVEPQRTVTLAMKDTSERSNRAQVAPLTRLEDGACVGSIAVAPDGSRVLFSVLAGEDAGSFRSQIMSVPTTGNGSAEILTDGKTLDLTPSFSPGGDRIIFASNRAGRRLQIWSMSARGEPGVTRLTTTDTNDLWPSLDSDPKPRLFYQALVDTRSDPRIYMTPVGTIFQTDLTLLSGTQPRVSPRNDAVLFCAANEQTGKRDIYVMNDRGGETRNLTNTPDIDEFDPAWSRDARRIAYASDAGVDAEDRRNHDIWVLDLSRPEKPVQVTTNGSLDDHPQFSPTDDAIYFRSNRGGEWGIWKVPLP